MLNVSKINEIRNINLIYVFSTNSIFDKENKLERYNKEKSKRNIVLLGDFTKKLIENASFYVLEEKEDKNNQINYYSYENKLLNKYSPYLFETLKLIFSEILKNTSFEITNLEGFNRKFKLDYSISGISKSTNAIIYNKDNELHFRVGNIENSNGYITGTIKQTNNKVISEFNYGKYKGKLEYDPLNNETYREIYADDYLYYISDNNETLLDEDMKKVKYYLNQIGVTNIEKILKINDDTYLCFYNENVEKEGELLYKENLIFMNFSEDRVDIIKTMREGFSKYDGIISVLLDEAEDTITVRKLYDLNNEFLVKEICHDNDYSYEVRDIDNDKNLSSDYSLEGFKNIEVETIDSIKQYKKGARR